MMSSGPRPRAGTTRRLANSSGFTIIEVTIVAAISLAVILSVVVAYEGTIRSWNGTAALLEIQREASLGIEAIENTVRPASSVVVSTGAYGDSLEIYYPGASGDTLAGRYSLDADGNLVDINGTVVASGIDSVSFTLQGGTALHIDAWLRRDPGTPDRATDDQRIYISSTAVCRN